MAGSIIQEGGQEKRASFTAVFAPRVQGIQFSEIEEGPQVQFKVHLSHFDRVLGRFRESSVEVRLVDGRVNRVEPPVVSAREFHHALKRYCAERFQARGGVAPSGEPRAVASLLQGVELRLAQRRGDRVRGPRPTDRLAPQMEFQEQERCPHSLCVLGRYHRRRHDFLGGEIPGHSRALFGFTTGNPGNPVFGELSEDALGADRAGSWELFAVADAHHGSRSGELALGKLLELFRLAFYENEHVKNVDVIPFLLSAFSRCHKAVVSDLRNEKSRTSLVAVIRKEEEVFWASVGDSLLFRVEENEVVRINRDMGHGVAGPRQSLWLGDKLFHQRFIDSGSDSTGGSGFCLCTDGIRAHPQHGARVLVKQLAEHADSPGAVHSIVRDLALQGKDNTSLIFFQGTEWGR